MSRAIRVFSPLENKTITYAAETAAKNTTFTVTISTFGTGTSPYGTNSYFPSALRIRNETDKPIFVKASPVASSTAATTADFEVPSGATEFIEVGQFDFVSVIPLSSATGNIYLARGNGS